MVLDIPTKPAQGEDAHEESERTAGEDSMATSDRSGSSNNEEKKEERPRTRSPARSVHRSSPARSVHRSSPARSPARSAAAKGVFPPTRTSPIRGMPQEKRDSGSSFLSELTAKMINRASVSVEGKQILANNKRLLETTTTTNLSDYNHSCPDGFSPDALLDMSIDDTTMDDNHTQMLQLQQQMVANQQQTNQALRELSRTMTRLMEQQVKRDEENDDDTKDLLSVDRATVRLDGLEVYAVVSALTVATAIACFDAYEMDKDANLFTVTQIDRTNIVRLLLNTIFLAVSGVGIVAGLHATLVFSLMTMYGRTAVGVSNDEGFIEFFVQTGRVRYRGFFTFKWSLYCFLLQVVFTITSKCSPLIRPFIVMFNLVIMWWVYRDTQDVIDKAGSILFNLTKQKQQVNKFKDQVNKSKDDPRRSKQGSSRLLLQRTLSVKNLSVKSLNDLTMSDSSNTNNADGGNANQAMAMMKNRARGRRTLSMGESSLLDSSLHVSGEANRGRGNTRRVDRRERIISRSRSGERSESEENFRNTMTRSKSGTEIFDVGPQDIRKRRAGRKTDRREKKHN